MNLPTVEEVKIFIRDNLNVNNKFFFTILTTLPEDLIRRVIRLCICNQIIPDNKYAVNVATIKDCMTFLFKHSNQPTDLVADFNFERIFNYLEAIDFKKKKNIFFVESPLTFLSHYRVENIQNYSQFEIEIDNFFVIKNMSYENFLSKSHSETLSMLNITDLNYGNYFLSVFGSLFNEIYTYQVDNIESLSNFVFSRKLIDSFLVSSGYSIWLLSESYPSRYFNKLYEEFQLILYPKTDLELENYTDELISELNNFSIEETKSNFSISDFEFKVTYLKALKDAGGTSPLQNLEIDKFYFALEKIFYFRENLRELIIVCKNSAIMTLKEYSNG